MDLVKFLRAYSSALLYIRMEIFPLLGDSLTFRVRPLALLSVSQRELRYPGKEREAMEHVCISRDNPIQPMGGLPGGWRADEVKAGCASF